MTHDLEGVDPDELRRLLIDARSELAATLDAYEEALREVRRLNAAIEAAADVRAVRDAVARQRHPSTRGDLCDPFGMPRPKLKVVR